MIGKVLLAPAKLLLFSFLLWIFLTTVLPQCIEKYTNSEIKDGKFTTPYYPYTSLRWPENNPIQNSTVYFIFAHPDDEVMFFSPTVSECLKPENGNQVKLISFSNGDLVDSSMGKIRNQELYSSSRILGINEADVQVLEYKDGANEIWDIDQIASTLARLIPKLKRLPVQLITFDEKGVSGHPNHIALFHGTRKYASRAQVRLYSLTSFNFFEKYSFTLLTNIELLLDYSTALLRVYTPLNIQIRLKSNDSSISYYSDLNTLSTSYAAMASGHFSQMVWFRYGWLVLSRYLNMNHLAPV